MGSFLVSLGLVGTLGFTMVFFLKEVAMFFYGLSNRWLITLQCNRCVRRKTQEAEVYRFYCIQK
jgi:hypothetical protein